MFKRKIKINLDNNELKLLTELLIEYKNKLQRMSLKLR